MTIECFALYVPYLYAAWMDARSGQWERYDCKSDSRDPEKPAEDDNIPRRVMTDGLATCVSINVISREGTIMTHFSPAICQMMNGEFDTKSAVARGDDENEIKRMIGQAENAKDIIRKLKKNHLGDSAKQIVVSISGPYGLFRDIKQVKGKQDKLMQNQVGKVVKKLFGLPLINKWVYLEHPHSERSITVDMTVSSPRLYKDRTMIPIHFPPTSEP